MTSKIRTLAITVNYKSSSLTLRAVQSVLESESLGPVQMVVVDNSEDREEAEALQSGLPRSVSLLVSPRNIGFGRACNRAIAGFRGEAILLVNPDAILFPGCLKRLQQTLFASKRAGAVSPHLFWDEGRRFYLPSSYPPPSLIFQDFLETSPPDARISLFLSALWRRHFIRVWCAKGPVKVGNLSGGLVLVKAAAGTAAGGWFDPRFFLYFEDTDLFLRMKRAGFKLLVEPRAQAVHNYDQCGRQNHEEKRSVMRRSRRLFWEKHCRGWRRGAGNMASYLKWRSGDSPQAVSPHLSRPFVLEIPKDIQEGWLFEVSPNPSFIPAAGRFGTGPVTAFPETCWRLLAPGRYFGRLGSPFRFGRYAHTLSWVI